MKRAYQIANIFGLDMNNAQHSIAVFDALEEIANPDEFVAYCREEKESIQYASKTEKLDILATRFKREQIEKKVEAKAEGGREYARELARKVAGCRNLVEEKDGMFRDVYIAGGGRLFESHELRALASLGLSTAGIIELSRRGELEEKIFEAYKSKVRAKIRRLPNSGAGQKRIENMAKKALRSS